eukprot:Sspe_Gene.46886::Locus_23584_Transcript_3_3_Confidence_0.429_Length_1117::g.46886::m.46886
MAHLLEDDDLMDELLHGDGMLGTFFSMLWQRVAGKRTHQLTGVNIPDTIIYLYSKPLHWFFSSRNGDIKKKSRSRLNSKYIEEQFLRNGTSVSGIKAVYYMTQPSAHNDSKVKITYTYGHDLRQFLQEDKPNGVLQLFFDPKPEVARDDTAVHNSVVQTTWSPGCFFIEKRVNKHRLDNHKIPTEVRAATFDDYQNTETVPLVSDAVAASFQRVCQAIADHISIVYRYKLVSLVLNFKIDRNDTIWLLWCSSLRIVSEERPGRALTATTSPPLQQYNKEQQALKREAMHRRAAAQRKREAMEQSMEAARAFCQCPLCLRDYPTKEMCSVATKTVLTALSGIDHQRPSKGIPTSLQLL